MGTCAGRLTQAEEPAGPKAYRREDVDHARDAETARVDKAGPVGDRVAGEEDREVLGAICLRGWQTVSWLKVEGRPRQRQVVVRGGQPR